MSRPVNAKGTPLTDCRVSGPVACSSSPGRLKKAAPSGWTSGRRQAGSESHPMPMRPSTDFHPPQQGPLLSHHLRTQPREISLSHHVTKASSKLHLWVYYSAAVHVTRVLPGSTTLLCIFKQDCPALPHLCPPVLSTSLPPRPFDIPSWHLAIRWIADWMRSLPKLYV